MLDILTLVSTVNIQQELNEANAQQGKNIQGLVVHEHDNGNEGSMLEDAAQQVSSAIDTFEGALGLTPVMYAVLYDDMDMLSTVLSTDGGLSDDEYLAHLNYQTPSHGLTASHIAVLVGNFRALKMLYECGADVFELRDTLQGQTVFEILQRVYKDHVQTIEDAFALDPSAFLTDDMFTRGGSITSEIVGESEEQFDADTLMDVLDEAVPRDLFGDGYLDVLSELLIVSKDLYYAEAVSRDVFVQCVADMLAVVALSDTPPADL